jgi:hypothetical protein
VEKCNKYLGSSLYLLVCCLIIGCSGNRNRIPDHPFQKKFQQQIEQSCAQPSVGFRKEVWDLTQQTESSELKTWDEMPMVQYGEARDGSDSMNFQLFQELDYGLFHFYDDEFLREYFTVGEAGDTLLALIKAENEEDTELKRQEIVQLGNEGPILYLRSLIEKENWLYALSVDIRIHFDSLGLYQEHQLEVQHRVSFIGSDFHSRILGQANYHD